jgi:predicted secreted Zn-dependent protease
MHQPLFAVALMAFGGSALAHVVVKEVTEFYDVRHSAGITLLDAINSVTPVRKNGQLFHGYTAWNISWTFRLKMSNAGSCEITSMTTTLPRLSISTQEAATQFNKFFPALADHEQ